MRTDLVPAAEALRLVLEGAQPEREETVALADAAFRVLSRDLAAKRTQPPFPASAMDGYALRADDIASVPATLRVTGQAAAGHPFAGTVGPGEAVRIFTGAPVPAGADTVVMQENTSRDGDAVTVLRSAEMGKSVRPAGLDFAAGDLLLKRGDLLGPVQLALAASMNHARVPVFAQPRVALIATGDELVAPGGEPGDGKIIASNTFGLAALIGASGGAVIDLGIAGDTRAALEAALAAAVDAGADLVVTTGGASVGDHDLVKPALLALGAELQFEKLAIRPGKPMLSGRLERGDRVVRFLGLAGNPVSSLVAAHVFVRPLVARLAGRPPHEAVPVRAVLGGDAAANDERQDYLRARVSGGADGVLVASPFAVQDSSMLAVLARSQGLVVRPPHAPAARRGEPCEIILLADV
ncbi:MAG: molybdopterin molybdenumtransferase MoeA [Alphaproteobacteria bacterium]|nr:MAG: molybdopterin molybdenumtransferase MoeA [Alphaproteobacteria bacterium]